jgi:hypothetical protein
MLIKCYLFYPYTSTKHLQLITTNTKYSTRVKKTTTNESTAQMLKHNKLVYNPAPIPRRAPLLIKHEFSFTYSQDFQVTDA